MLSAIILFFQRKTTRQRGCQIDYMIQTKLNTLIVCEIKFSIKEVPFSIIEEVKTKLERLVKTKRFFMFPSANTSLRYSRISD